MTLGVFLIIALSCGLGVLIGMWLERNWSRLN